MTRRATSASIVPLVLGAALCTGTASAAVFDFSDLSARVKAREGRELLWAEAMPDGWSVDGITVTAGEGAFLDGPFRSRGFDNASSGLGLCNDPSGDCNKSDFDGVRDAGERLTIMFDTVVSAAWTLRETTAAWAARTGPDHTLANGCAKVNGVEREIRGGALLGDLLASASWAFEPCAQGGTDFYVTAAAVEPVPAPVPVPAGIVLLGSALAGLGWRARRASR